MTLVGDLVTLAAHLAGAAPNLILVVFLLVVVGMLGYLIWGQKHTHDTQHTIANNHLHELPAIAQDIRILVETVQRLERNQAENFAHIKARLNGKH